MRRALVLAAIGLTLSPALADWTASGRFEYRDRVFGRTGFTGEEPTLPVRWADVEVLDYPELGMEAVWKIDIVDFPAFIIVDDKGNDFFSDVSKPVRIRKL